MRTILSISQDDGLLLARTAVLRRTDAEVIAARADEAKKILKKRRFDLVVLCHSLSPEDTLEIASLARHQTIAVPVLRVVSKTDSVSEWAFVAPDAAASCDPRVLVEKVAELLNVSCLGSNYVPGGECSRESMNMVDEIEHHKFAPSEEPTVYTADICAEAGHENCKGIDRTIEGYEGEPVFCNCLCHRVINGELN